MGIPISSAEDDAGFATLIGTAQEEDAEWLVISILLLFATGEAETRGPTETIVFFCIRTERVTGASNRHHIAIRAGTYKPRLESCIMNPKGAVAVFTQ
jgi:hypothetical protein